MTNSQPTTSRLTQATFHLLAKPTGAICNLDCTYCFFLSKDALYPGDRMRMSTETLEAYLKQLLASQPDGPVSIAWQGGEPTLMGLDFYRQVIELIKRYARPTQIIEHTMQTNGTLLDDDWAKFLKQNSVLVGLSIDGPQAMHDQYRVWKDGRGSFDDVVKAWGLLQRHQVDTNILCSLSAANADHPTEVYQFFRDELGAKHIQFIPIVERSTPVDLEIAEKGWSEKPGRRRILYTQQGNLVTSRSITGKQYGDFLSAVFDEWLAHDVGEVFIQIFDVTLGAHVGMYSLCVHAPTCGSALALEHNGDMYSCDHFVEPDYKLGNIHQSPMIDLVTSPQQVQFGRNKQSLLPRMCQECDVRFACNGGCPKDRFINTPHGEPGLNYLCEGFQTFFRHVDAPMKRMAELISQGRFADEIMSEG
jgi:uncharacterized protein